MRVTDEMVEAACAVFVRAYEPDRVPHSSDLIRSAIEAALAAAPACPHIRSSGPPERATNWCALAAAPQAEPVAWAQKAALDGVREYGEIIATLYADGYQPEQEWTEPLYAAPPALAAPRPLLTVSELQQALVDVGLIYPEAIDDAEGFDDYVTLEQIDELHKMLTQAAPDALREALGDER